MTRSFAGKRIWIIGASSGIGAALAKGLAKDGAELILSARSGDALEHLRESLGAKHRVIPVDVTDAEGVSLAANHAQQGGNIDSIVFLAAAYEPMEMESLDIAATRKIFDVNVMGAIHVIHAVLPILKAQGQGQLALCGSVAAYVGLPHAQPYSATKAAIRSLAQSLRAEMAHLPKVDIKLISPGFVRTPLTDKNSFPMPFIMEPEKAADYLAKGLLSARFEIHFPKRFTLLMKTLALLPYPLYFHLMKNIR